MALKMKIAPPAKFLWPRLQRLGAFKRLQGLTYQSFLFLRCEQIFVTRLPVESPCLPLPVESPYLPLCDYFVTPPRLRVVACGRCLFEFCSLWKVKDLCSSAPAGGLMRHFLASKQRHPAQKEAKTKSLVSGVEKVHLNQSLNTIRQT